jgi:pre-mRNA-splicing factor CDC5/CEF1
VFTDYPQNVQSRIISYAEKGNTLEQKLVKLHTGYMIRSKTLRQKINEAADFLAKTSIDVDVKRIAAAAEEAGLNERLEKIREEVNVVARREREAQGTFRERKEELNSLVTA